MFIPEDSIIWRDEEIVFQNDSERSYVRASESEYIAMFQAIRRINPIYQKYKDVDKNYPNTIEGARQECIDSNYARVLATNNVEIYCAFRRYAVYNMLMIEIIPLHADAMRGFKHINLLW